MSVLGKAAAAVLLSFVCRALPATTVGQQDPPVTLVASAGESFACEVRAAPGTRVVIAASGALGPGGRTLAADDTLLLTASEPLLRGATDRDGVFRTRVPIDPMLRDRLPGVLYAQAARLLPDGGTADLSPIVSIQVEPASRLAGWARAAAVLAALLALVWLPEKIRPGLARTLAWCALAAAPILLARAFASKLLAAPDVPESVSPASAGAACAAAALAAKAVFGTPRGRPKFHFETAMALLGLVIVCLPAWLRTGGVPNPAVVITASILVLLGALGATPLTRLAASLAQAAVLLAWPLVSRSWLGAADLALAVFLLGAAVLLGPAGLRLDRVLIVIGAGFLLLREWLAGGATAWLFAAEAPDVRRAGTLATLVTSVPGRIALVVPAFAATACAALVLRKASGGPPRWAAAVAVATAGFAIGQVIGMLGSPAYLTIEVGRSFDRLLVQTFPIALAALVAVVSRAGTTPSILAPDHPHSAGS